MRNQHVIEVQNAARRQRNIYRGNSKAFRIVEIARYLMPLKAAGENNLVEKTVEVLESVKSLVQNQQTSSFLVQSFKETLQYCDEWRKFTSVSQSDSQSVSES